MWKPELLSPAGSLDKLKVAVSYGADAVYLAGQKFGLRTAAENFTLAELEEGIGFAHARGAKVFIVLNGFLHDSELEELPQFVGAAAELGADAVIASDLGVISTVARTARFPIHLSTQASCLNRHSGSLWKKLGVSRLILGREVSIEAAGEIKKQTGLEVELFIHGSMCMAYSGNCTISNFTQGRDSNRGGCSQSCRFHYSLDFSDGQKAAHSTFMSSKDLMGIEYLPYFFEHKIDSLKIEGRMRSQLYAGEISKIYREAIDQFAAEGKLNPESLSAWSVELEGIPHREYTAASLNSPAGPESIYLAGHEKNSVEHAFVGLIRKVDPERKYALIEVRTGFLDQDEIEVVLFQGNSIAVRGGLKNALGAEISKANPNMLVRIPYQNAMAEGQIVRKQVVAQ